MQDDSFVRGSDDPYWNESTWNGFSIPDRKILGWVYVWHRPNMNLSAAGVALWDPYGDQRHNCLYYHWFNFNPLPENADMFDFSLENGLSMEALEPHQRYRALYKADDGCELDLTWTGMIKPQLLTFGEYDKGMGDFGSGHYEQFAHVTGSVVVEGETLPVDCYNVRDRSWGPRPPLKNLPGGGLELGWASEQTSFCVTTVNSQPADHYLPGATQRAGYGWVVKDGVSSRVASAQRHVTKRAPTGRPLEIVLDVSDELGRETHIQGQTENCLEYDDLWFEHWCLAHWSIDGEEAWGESQDWPRADVNRRYQRSLQLERKAGGGND